MFTCFLKFSCCSLHIQHLLDKGVLHAAFIFLDKIGCHAIIGDCTCYKLTKNLQQQIGQVSMSDIKFVAELWAYLAHSRASN